MLRLHTKDRIIEREKDHIIEREKDVARNVSTPPCPTCTKQPERAPDDKIPQQVETSQGDVTGHRSAVLLGGAIYRGFTPVPWIPPIPWVAPTAVLLRSYGAFQRRNPPCPAGKTAGKSAVGADG